jgi:ribosomal protein S18 acetylase RimI-like enzyme
MSDPITVRKATIADAAAVAELMTGLTLSVGIGGTPLPQALDPEYATLTVDDAARRMQAMAAVEEVFLAESAGEAVGFMSLRLVPYLDQDVPDAEVMNLFVRSEARRQGVARRLIEEAERVAREAGATSVHIMTGAENREAQAFYLAAGYEMANVSFERFLEPERETARA